MGSTFIRFETRRFALLGVVAILAAVPLTGAEGAHGTVDRIRQTGRIRFGYRADARPFSYRTESGQAAGYSVALCEKVADGVKADLRLPALTVEWVPVTLDDRFRTVEQKQIDLLCGADTVTLSRRADVAFSIPVFPGGIGALVRGDASSRLRDVLAGRGQTFHPTWRASAAQALQSRAFVSVAGTTSEQWLADRVKELQIVTEVSSVGSYDAGITDLLARKADTLFGERAILLDASRRHSAARDLHMIDRLFSYEPLAFARARDDDDFGLLVDRAISRTYRSGEIAAIYARSFGEPDNETITFFRWNALPD
jgi:ABC-type amino acid transport substrate-binding protein